MDFSKGWDCFLYWRTQIKQWQQSVFEVVYADFLTLFISIPSSRAILFLLFSSLPAPSLYKVTLIIGPVSK